MSQNIVDWLDVMVMTYWLDIILVCAAYLLGSVCSAIIVCRLWGLSDPRTEGSGNPGATNVFRIGGRLPALVTLLGDGLKGLLPVLLVQVLALNLVTVAAVGLAAFLGHLYPLWFNFRGGKGVATALGVQIGWYWLYGSTIGLLWLGIYKLTKLSSLSALISMILAPLILWWMGVPTSHMHMIAWPAFVLVITQVIMSALLIWRHRKNIRQLLAGTEA